MMIDQLGANVGMESLKHTPETLAYVYGKL